MKLHFVVLGQPRQKGSTTAFVVPKKGVKQAIAQGAAVKQQDFTAVTTGDNPRAKFYEKEIRDEAAKYMTGPLWDCAVMLSVFFVMPRPQRLKPGKFEPFTKTPDTDKMLRCVLDALTHVVYRDDALVVQATESKRYANAGEAPHTTITVWQATVEDLMQMEVDERLEQGGATDGPAAAAPPTRLF